MGDSGSGVEFISVETLLNSVIEQNDDQTRPTEVNDLNSMTTINGKFECPECPHRFRDRDRLVRHVRKTHRGQKPYLCYMCDYGTVNRTMFQEHLHMHQGLKPYKCTHCDYHSASKKYIKKHELKHIKCDNCGFLAKNMKSLSKHKNSNCAQQTLKYSCKNCKKKFSNETDLNNHIEDKKYCDICGENFCSKLTAHMKKFHGELCEKTVSFSCKLCEWVGNSEMKILLHLVHHPQKVSDERLDLSILRKYGILND